MKEPSSIQSVNNDPMHSRHRWPARRSVEQGFSIGRDATKRLFIACAILMVMAISDRDASAEQKTVEEVHAISISKGKYGQVDVQVSVTGRPIVLFLSAYDAVEWVIRAGPDVSIQKVLISGYYESVLKGLPSSVPILTLPKESRLNTFWIDGSWMGDVGATYRNVVTKAKTYLNLSVSTFQGGQTGESFVIDGKRTILYPPSVLEAEADLKPFLPMYSSPQAGSSGYGTNSLRLGHQAPGSSLNKASARNRPIAKASGPITADMIERYRVIAVFPLKDAPNVPNSGTTAASMIVGQLTAKGFTVVDRTQLDRLFEEQRLQLTHGDEQKIQLKVGRLVGASAVIVGEVRHWMNDFMSMQGMRTSNVGHAALSFRLVDAESGIVLFSGEAEFPQALLSSPQDVGQTLVRLIISRLAQKVGLESSGQVGFNWDMESYADQPTFVVREFEADSPAYQAGLRPGDVILSCNGSASATWKTLWTSMRRCRSEAEEILRLEVRRNGKVLAFSITARDKDVVLPDH